MYPWSFGVVSHFLGDLVGDWVVHSISVPSPLLFRRRVGCIRHGRVHMSWIHIGHDSSLERFHSFFHMYSLLLFSLSLVTCHHYSTNNKNPEHFLFDYSFPKLIICTRLFVCTYIYMNYGKFRPSWESKSGRPFVLPLDFKPNSWASSRGICTCRWRYEIHGSILFWIAIFIIYCFMPCFCHWKSVIVLLRGLLPKRRHNQRRSWCFRQERYVLFEVFGYYITKLCILDSYLVLCSSYFSLF